MIGPKFPLILINEMTELDLIYSQDYFKYAGLMTTADSPKNLSVFFDQNGIKWECYFTKVNNSIIITEQPKADNKPNNSEYNVTWSSLGTFHIKELKSIVVHCIQKDGVLLSKYENVTLTNHLITNSFYIRDITNILNKHFFHIDEKNLWEDTARRRR